MPPYAAQLFWDSVDATGGEIFTWHTFLPPSQTDGSIRWNMKLAETHNATPQSSALTLYLQNSHPKLECVASGAMDLSSVLQSPALTRPLSSLLSSQPIVILLLGGKHSNKGCMLAHKAFFVLQENSPAQRQQRLLPPSWRASSGAKAWVAQQAELSKAFSLKSTPRELTSKPLYGRILFIGSAWIVTWALVATMRMFLACHCIIWALSRRESNNISLDESMQRTNIFSPLNSGLYVCQSKQQFLRIGPQERGTSWLLWIEPTTIDVRHPYVPRFNNRHPKWNLLRTPVPWAAHWGTCAKAFQIFFAQPFLTRLGRGFGHWCVQR